MTESHYRRTTITVAKAERSRTNIVSVNMYTVQWPSAFTLPSSNNVCLCLNNARPASSGLMFLRLEKLSVRFSCIPVALHNHITFSRYLTELLLQNESPRNGSENE